MKGPLECYTFFQNSFFSSYSENQHPKLKSSWWKTHFFKHTMLSRGKLHRQVYMHTTHTNMDWIPTYIYLFDSSSHILLEPQFKIFWERRHCEITHGWDHGECLFWGELINIFLYLLATRTHRVVCEVWPWASRKFTLELLFTVLHLTLFPYPVAHRQYYSRWKFPLHL